MLTRTHLAISVFVILLLLPNVAHKTTFVIVALIATLIPDVDSIHSTVGKNFIMRIFQFLTRHRGILHSFTLVIIVSIVLAFYAPIVALPFFVGYAWHLFFDSWTIEGITPFWPLKNRSSGKIKVGGIIEKNIFWFAVVADVFLLWLMFLI